MALIDFLEEARQQADLCWCDPTTSDREKDVVLAEVFAQRLAAWMDTAAQNQRNTEFYRGLLDQCAENLGPLRHKAFEQQDSGVVDSPLPSRIPKLIAELVYVYCR